MHLLQTLSLVFPTFFAALWTRQVTKATGISPLFSFHPNLSHSTWKLLRTRHKITVHTVLLCFVLDFALINYSINNFSCRRDFSVANFSRLTCLKNTFLLPLPINVSLAGYKCLSLRTVLNVKLSQHHLPECSVTDKHGANLLLIEVSAPQPRRDTWGQVLGQKRVLAG